MLVLRPLCFLMLSACTVVGQVGSSELTVFMSPVGEDAASGRTAAASVASLQRALDVAIADATATTRRIVIAVAAGVYTGQRAVTAGHPHGIPIVIEPASCCSGVHFDGAGAGGTWLTIRPSAAGANISVRHLEISAYVTAINLAGSREDQAQSVRGVEIISNQIKRIGQVAYARGAPSTAAIRLVNADEIKITDNHFAEIRNNARCGLLHAVYVAHGSTRNLIQDNRFESSCGDAVRLRDNSNDNEIVGNQFSDAWAFAPVSEWFCNGDTRTDCSQRTGECPSVGNIVRDNKIIVTTASRPKPVESFDEHWPSYCPPAARQRFTVLN